MLDLDVYDTAEGATLELGDQVVYTDYEGEDHHIEIFELDDQNTDIVGSGYCHDCDDNHCTFDFGAFEEVDLWRFI